MTLYILLLSDFEQLKLTKVAEERNAGVRGFESDTCKDSKIWREISFRQYN